MCVCVCVCVFVFCVCWCIHVAVALGTRPAGLHTELYPLNHTDLFLQPHSLQKKKESDSPQHWPSKIEIDESWDTPEAFERILKFHSIPALTKYIRSCSLLCAPDIDGWRMKNLLQRIFLSSDTENEDLKVLVYDCLYIPW